MGGTFSEWQPRYAEHTIATFPVKEKRPAVKNYLKLGLLYSSQLAIKFPEAESFGFACRHNRITVLDVDCSDERLLADAMDEFGTSPFVVRSGSGNFQVWYRHGGERRKVRPDPSRPIDILGDGFVVAPPSRGTKGYYSIIEGCLDDLARLPRMRHSTVARCDPAAVCAAGLVGAGQRNDQLWTACMKRASSCGSFDELLEIGMHLNQAEFYEPLPADEVLKVVASAWQKECTGENWFGRGARVVWATEDIDTLLRNDPDAFILLTILKRHHWGPRKFVIANAMADTMPGGGWSRKRFAATRHRLERMGVIQEHRPASRQHGPALYQFKGGRR
ncbi:hypothetical protein G7077_06785 [Sphingomonas piscis]|uniref:DNA primase/polymerase bifunctional N-terminal domain-containing protein n=1 Tax=Sphingomonas piscis TaxID=2714943 RepID=A0A6G7YPH8_9SPHN|nr:bifunctional DNA primase/polymerase [Sphingomonas piscis]QIK78644.1 hypothetical protein G7077_06785 [Sphingomonas piscis]